jgi:hypothetical protein
MAMKEKTGGGNFGQQGNARQGLLGTLAATLLGYEVKEWEKKDQKGKVIETVEYIDGRLKVAGSEHFSFFQIWPSANKPNLVEEFQEWYPDNDADYEFYPLCAPSQRPKEKEFENAKGEIQTRIEYTTSLKVFAWKDESDFDEKRDGYLTGTLLFLEQHPQYSTEETSYRRAREDKPSFAQLVTKAVSTFERGGKPQTKEDIIVLQCFAEDADNAFKVLSDKDIADGVPLYVYATMRGGRLTLVSAKKNNAAVPTTAEEAGEPGEAEERPAAGPKKPSFGSKKGGEAATSSKPSFKKTAPASEPAPAKKSPWKK